MLDRIETWARGLAELTAHGDALARAIASGDVIAAIAASQEARTVRGWLAGTTPPAPTAPDEVRALGEARTLAVGARYAEAIVERWRSRTLPPDEQLATTPIGAAVLADQILPAAWDPHADVVVLVGPGWDAVVEVMRAFGQRRLIVLDGGDGPPPDGAIAAADLDEVARAVRTMDPMSPRRCTVRGLGAARARVAETAEVVRGCLSDLRVHRNTVAAFSRTWIAQGARNLPAVARWPSIGAVRDRLAGVPMIIVAPGPSLAKNAALLKAAKGKAIIAALSHSLKPVIAAGVVPDVVFSVDPQDVRYHFAGIDLSATTLINGVTVHPSLFELGAKRYLTLAANTALDDWMYAGLGEEPRAAGGGSVATTAFTVARRWRCDPIIMVGLDLSFPGGQYYVGTSCDGGARAVKKADGTITVEGWSDRFHDMKKHGGPAVPKERAVELPGWHGGTVPSSFMFSMFHRWFVEQARAITAEGGGRLYNCTEGGAFIDGMTHATLASVLDELPAQTLDVGAVLDEVVASVDSAGRAAQLACRTSTLVQDLARAAKLAKRCDKLAASAATDPRAERRLTARERELVGALGDLGFVSMLAQRDIQSALAVAERAGEAAQTIAASRALFAAMIAAAREVGPHLEAAARALGAGRAGGEVERGTP